MLFLPLLLLAVLIPGGDNKPGKSSSGLSRRGGRGLGKSNLSMSILYVSGPCVPSLSFCSGVGGGARGPGTGKCLRHFVVQTLGSFSMDLSGFHPPSLAISSCFSLFFFFFFTFLILFLPTAFQGPTTFHLNQISSFANSTWAQNQGSGWLGDLQIHGWNSESGTAIFLKPWSKGNLSDEEVTELEEIFRVYLIGFLRVIQDHVSEFQLTCECCPLERLSVISLFLLFRHHTPGSFSLSPQFIQLL